MAWETVVHTREDLFARVWAEPVVQVAKRMGISDVALAKICKRMAIPLPGRGYWARKAAGYASSRPRLRAPSADTPLTYTEHRRVGESIEADSEVRDEVRRQVQQGPPVLVPDTLLDPHPLIVRTAAIMPRGQRALDTILLRRRCLDVSARGDALDRALRIMDTVLKAVESRGYTVEVTAPVKPTGEPRSLGAESRTLVHIGDSAVQIGINEVVEKIPLPLPEPRKPRTPYEYIPRPKRQYEYRPTGRLTLRIKNAALRGAPEMWSDRKGKKVEDYVNDFVASISVAAERQRLDRIEAEKRRQEAVARAQREKAIALQNDAYDVLEADVKGRLADWRFAKDIDAFAAAVRARAKAEKESVEPESPNGRWLEWARFMVEILEFKTIGNLFELRNHEGGYKLRERFGWGRAVTTMDALTILLTSIDDLVEQEELRARAVTTGGVSGV
jgi:hypothetical protein